MKTPIIGRASPRQEAGVSLPEGSDGNWLSLKAKTATTVSGRAR
ncbi:MAG: hypothetical protein R3D59_12905 [Paracoccaceae bacterium]